jgi:hypothetical protein
MVVETASKSVLHDDHAQAYPVPGPRPLLDHGGAQRWQIMLEVAMGLEAWPEDVGHGKDDADEGHIGSVVHCSRCQSRVPRLPQLGQHFDLQVW